MGVIVQKGIKYSGTNVVPNPAESASDTLSKVKINGTTFGIEGENYTAGKLINISNINAINVSMEQSTPQDIEQESAQNPNVLYFTEGTPQGAITAVTKTLTVNGWVSNMQSVRVDGIVPSSVVFVSPVSDMTDNFDNYTSAGIRAVSQADNVVTFKCKSVPSSVIYVNIGFFEINPPSGSGSGLNATNVNVQLVDYTINNGG